MHMYVCVYKCMYMYVCINVCICINVYMCVYVCMYVRILVYVQRTFDATLETSSVSSKHHYVKNCFLQPAEYRTSKY
jgi:hypothetical protein